jgi:hypothetical protein
MVLINALFIGVIFEAYLHLTDDLTLTKSKIYEKVSVSRAKSIFNPYNFNLWVLSHIINHFSDLWDGS